MYIFIFLILVFFFSLWLPSYRLRKKEEEQERSPKFEYKTLKSPKKGFKNVSLILEQEKKKGWELVEFYQNSNIRLRKPK